MSYNVGDAIAVSTIEEAPVAVVAEGEAAKKIEGRSPWVLAWRRLRRDRAAMIALGLIGLMALFAPAIAAVLGHGVYQQFRGTNPAGLTPLGQPVGPSSTF